MELTQAIFGLILIGTTLYDLKTGDACSFLAFGDRWFDWFEIRAHRKTSPVLYWILILIQASFGVWLVVHAYAVHFGVVEG